ncbi:metallophosphoesterase family protein [Candidatus Pacearchaeota archaeon]|nr:metallophosphoesterase family protein [Candidatus Pacearchaeota archaeon]
MKHIYAISDTHDDLEAVARAVDFMKAEGLKNSRIIHVGDLSLRPYTLLAWQQLLKSGDVEEFRKAKRTHNEGILREYKRILDASGMPYTTIPGNYDGPLGEVFGDKDIHNKALNLEGITVAGYGGGGNLDDDWIGQGNLVPLYRMGEIQLFDPKELRTLLEKENPQIAVIHNPPYGLCDDMHNGKHVGTPTSRRYLQEDNNLRLVLSGHIHEAGPNGNNLNGVGGVNGIEKKNGEACIVINPGNLGRFELIDPETLETARQFDYGTFVRVDVEDDGAPEKLLQYTVQEEWRRIGQVRLMRISNLKAT